LYVPGRIGPATLRPYSWLFVRTQGTFITLLVLIQWSRLKMEKIIMKMEKHLVKMEKMEKMGENLVILEENISKGHSFY
jgi:hypothetical protein